jgi:hypothetical protein
MTSQLPELLETLPTRKQRVRHATIVTDYVLSMLEDQTVALACLPIFKF